MIVLYEFRASPYCAKVRKVLEFKKLPFRAVEVSFLARSEPKRLSGQGRVPVIDDGGKVVSDSTVIAQYLDATYPEHPVLPTEPGGRARALLLEDWADEAFAFHAVPFKILPLGNAERLVGESIQLQGRPFLLRILAPFGPMVLRQYARKRRAQGRKFPRIAEDFGRTLDILELGLGALPFIAGDAPTVADFAVYGFLVTMEGLAGFETVTARPRLADWYQRVRAL